MRELRDPVKDGSIMRARREDLFSDEVQVHVQGGKRVMKPAMTWKERVSVVLDEHFVILGRLRFGMPYWMRLGKARRKLSWNASMWILLS